MTMSQVTYSGVRKVQHPRFEYSPLTDGWFLQSILIVPGENEAGLCWAVCSDCPIPENICSSQFSSYIDILQPKLM